VAGVNKKNRRSLEETTAGTFQVRLLKVLDCVGFHQSGFAERRPGLDRPSMPELPR
jgi:hypothetical protein